MMGTKESSSGSSIGRLAMVILGFCAKADTSIGWELCLMSHPCWDGMA